MSESLLSKKFPNFISYSLTGRTVEIKHTNGELLTFSIDTDKPSEVVNQWPLKDRIKYFHDNGTMVGY